jgi:hypothetical protein
MIVFLLSCQLLLSPLTNCLYLCFTPSPTRQQKTSLCPHPYFCYLASPHNFQLRYFISPCCGRVEGAYHTSTSVGMLLWTDLPFTILTMTLLVWKSPIVFKIPAFLARLPSFSFGLLSCYSVMTEPYYASQFLSAARSIALLVHTLSFPIRTLKGIMLNANIQSRALLDLSIWPGCNNNIFLSLGIDNYLIIFCLSELKTHLSFSDRLSSALLPVNFLHFDFFSTPAMVTSPYLERDVKP